METLTIVLFTAATILFAVPVLSKVQETPTTRFGFVQNAQKPSNSSTCVVCETASTFIHEILRKRNHLTMLSDHSSSSTCSQRFHNPVLYKKMTSIMGDLVALFNTTDHRTICQSFDFCPKYKPVHENLYVSAVRSWYSKIGCGLCNFIVSVLDCEIMTHEQMLKGYADEFCHRLPPPLDKKCLSVIDPDFPGIIKAAIDRFLSPSAVCKNFLKVCPGL